MAWRHALLVLTRDHWKTCEHTRHDPFQRPPLRYKDSYSTHHIHYGNAKAVLYIRKVYYMNKIYTKLWHSLPGLVYVKLKLTGKILTLLQQACNRVNCMIVRFIHFYLVHSLSLVYVRHFLNHTIIFLAPPLAQRPRQPPSLPNSSAGTWV